MISGWTKAVHANSTYVHMHACGCTYPYGESKGEANICPKVLSRDMLKQHQNK